MAGGALNSTSPREAPLVVTTHRDAAMSSARVVDRDERPALATLQTGPGDATKPAEGAMRHLFETYHPAIWRLLRRLGVGASRLDDAAQEVFWVAARKLPEIRRGSEHAFLYGVAVRIAAQEHRRRKATPPTTDIDDLLGLMDAGPSPEQQLQQQQARALLDLVLDRMPIELRTLFVLCELEELEVRDAAALEGIPLGTASSRLRRARDEFSAIAKRVRATLLAHRGLR